MYGNSQTKVKRVKKNLISCTFSRYNHFRRQNENGLFMLKFIYSEKATKFYEISTVDLFYVVAVKSTVEILQNFVAFSEYMNFTNRF